MKVLWIVNLLPIDLCQKLNIASENLGGWVESMAGALSRREEIRLTIACKCGGDVSFSEQIGRITYISVGYDSSTAYDDICRTCTQIIAEVKPDIVQIEGTEFLHAKAMLAAAQSVGIPVLVSLQGILSGYYPYQCGELPIDDMMFSKSFTAISAAWLLHLRKTRWFAKRVPAENEVISRAAYITGRTFWDRAHAYRLNPKAAYYTCNRTLRPPFYEKRWDITQIERHSIYIGNGYSALKGAHFMVEALPQLIQDYPDIKVYIAGVRPFEQNDRRPFYKRGYGAYLEKRIRDLKVGGHIVFTGSLSAGEVSDRLSGAHVYVLCSTIENSPNTLGEAMLIGTPCVAAYVGGAPEMAADGKEALFYRSNDPALLAWNIKRVFDDDELALRLSHNARQRALVTHDPERNADKLIENYRDILKDGEKETEV